MRYLPRLKSLWQRLPKLSPTTRLTLSYLGILMAVSLTLTVALYRVSSAEAERGLQREHQYYGSFKINPFDLGYDQELLHQINTVNQHLRANLIAVNLVIVVIGGGLSYYLAKRTLRPIETALAAQSRFAGDASHELRTPLTAMKSELEVALRDPKLPATDARELLESNLEEVVKLETLAAGLLRLARHDQEPVPLVAVDLAAVTAEATSRLRVAAERRKVTVTDTASGRVLGDFDSLVELTAVLLDNAIKYSHPGGEVTLGSKPHGSHISLSIRDEGAGIAPANLPHIFERFYRADSSRSKATPGYGLGLSIAAQIAQVHRATIDATSRQGGGSTFTVHLQAADSPRP